MEPTHIAVEIESSQSFKNTFMTVTTFSKVCAAIVFITLPFAGFWLGLQYESKDSSLQQRTTVPEATEIALESRADAPQVVSTTSEAVPQRASGADPTRAEFENIFAQLDASKKDQDLHMLETSWPEISRQEFSYQDQVGVIYQLCYLPAVFVHRIAKDEQRVCLGANAIVAEWGGKREIIDFLHTPRVDDIFFLSEVGFNEGVFQDVTTSLHPDALLYVMRRFASCMTIDGMCINRPDLAYAIHLPMITASKVAVVAPYLFSLDQLSWNKFGTRAVMVTVCTEGCPDEEVVGLDFESGKKTEFTSRAGSSAWVQKEEIQWVDEKTFTIKGKQYSF